MNRVRVSVVGFALTAILTTMGCQDRVRIKVKVRIADAGLTRTATTAPPVTNDQAKPVRPTTKPG